MEQAEAGFGGAENGAKGGEARRIPKLTQLIKARLEAEAEEIIGPVRAMSGCRSERYRP